MVKSATDTPLPKGWRTVLLREVADINQNKWTPRHSGPIRYLDLTAVATPGRLSPPRDLSTENAPSRARRLVRSGDTLISGSSEMRGELGWLGWVGNPLDEGRGPP